MEKNNRLNDIISLIEKYEIDTQEELTAKLKELGYNVSQATVSRDIKNLNLIKSAGSGKKYKYVKSLAISSLSDKIKNLFKQVTISITAANNLLVVKTLAGNAGTAGMAVDAMHISEILGTIAGDDTLLIVAKSNSDAELILKSLRTLF